MVSLLQFAISTLHVWEKRGKCAFPPSSSGHYEVFSLGTFQFWGRDRSYCFALANVSSSPVDPDWPDELLRHDIWPLTVMLEMMVVAVVLGYLWSAYLGDREFQFELHFSSCLGRVLNELRGVRQNVEVVRFRGGDPDVVYRSGPLFQNIGTLPWLKGISIDNMYHPFPMNALTAMLRGLGTKRQLEIPSCQSKQGHPITTTTTSRLQSLELRAQELTGTPTELVHLCAQIKGIGCSSLRYLKLGLSRHREHYNTIRNETMLQWLLEAIKHHPVLEELELKGPTGLSRGETIPNNIHFSTLPDPTNPMIEALIEVVRTCKELRRLRLNLCSRQGQSVHDDTLYIAPLAKAMSQPAFYTNSNLQSLQLLLHSRSERRASFVQSLVALEQMVLCNSNITHLFLGPSPGHEEYGDAHDCYNMLCHRERDHKYTPRVVRHLKSTQLYVTLNRLGRKRLLSDPCTTQSDWIQAILQNKDNISISFCWITMNPSVLPV